MFSSTLLVLMFLAGVTPPEPDMADVFHRLDGDKLVALERQAFDYRYSGAGFMYMRSKSYSEFPGAKSPVRFAAGRLELVVRSMQSPADMDLNGAYSLYKLSVKKQSRELVTTSGSISPFRYSSKNTPGLPVEFSTYGSKSLKLRTGELGPGEYAVGRPYGPSVFCFGVD